MHFSTAFAATAFAATVLAAPSPECANTPPAHYGRPGRPAKHHTSSPATVDLPETCTAVVTSVATKYVTETIAPQPTGYPGNDAPEAEECLTEEEADQMAEVFRQLIQGYSDEVAMEALTEDFVDYASVVNSLMNRGAQYPKNITGPTFASRAEFMDGQGSQPEIPFERLQTFFGCRHVTVRWYTERSGNGQPTEQAMIPVVGIAAMEVVPAEPENPTYNWRIQTLYSEFNSLAWAVNLGLFTPEGPVDYINGTNMTTTPVTNEKRSLADFPNYDPSFRGPAI